MYKKQIVSTLALLFGLITIVHAQYTLQGHIKDSLGLPIAGAVIQLSNTATAETSQADGTFVLRGLSKGENKIQVAALGYQPKVLTIQHDGLRDINQYNITLVESSALLKQVEITAQKQLIEYRSGKIIVNVEKSPLATGNNALDIFGMSPGVEVQGGAISILGKPNTAVYLDGKPLYVTGDQLVTVLQGMSSEQISAIEIIKNPSSKYDVSSGSGIINIRTKKNPNEGMNGIATVNYGQGFYHKFISSLHLNYRNKKVNVYSNYTFNQSIDRQERPAYVHYFDEVPASDFRQDQLSKITPNNHSISGGIDIKLSPKTTLGLMTRHVFLDRTTRYATHTSVTTAGAPDSVIQTSGDIQFDSYLQLYNLNLKSNLSEAATLDFNLDYAYFRAQSNQLIQFAFFDPGLTAQRGTLWFRNEIPTSIPILGANADYTRKLSETTGLEAGFKLSQTKPHSDLEYANRWDNGDWETPVSEGNQFDFQERLAAVYAMLNKTHKKVEWQAGLRLQRIENKGNTEISGSDFKNVYLNVFPSADVKYAHSEKHQYRFGYTTSMSRPTYNMLSPFTVREDPYTATTGNPFVIPSYSTDIELQYIFKSKYIAALEFETIKNRIEQLTFQDYEHKQLTNVLTNIDRNNYYRLYFILPVTVTKKWTSNNTLNNYIIEYKTPLAGNLYHRRKAVFYISSQNTIALDKKTTGEFYLYYRTPSLNGVFEVGERYFANIAVKRTVLDGKGTLALSVSDIFRTNIWQMDIDYLRQRSGYAEYNDTRVYKIVFSYKFGKKQFKNHRERRTGVTEETGRIQ